MNATSPGFTLYELLVSLLVAGIVLGFGVPNFLEFQRNNAIIGAANNLVSAIYLARTEAVRSRVPVTLCASEPPYVQCGAANGFTDGFIVFIDENNNPLPSGAPNLTDPTDGNGVVDANERILLERPAVAGATITMTTDNGAYVTYGPNGFSRTSAPAQALDAATLVLICDERGNRDLGGRSSARVVRLDFAGRPQTLQGVADVAAAAAATGGTCP